LPSFDPEQANNFNRSQSMSLENCSTPPGITKFFLKKKKLRSQAKAQKNRFNSGEIETAMTDKAGEAENSLVAFNSRIKMLLPNPDEFTSKGGFAHDISVHSTV